MLIGDAAGTVSPVTGGGIHTALHFGRRAALLVVRITSRIVARIRWSALARELPRYRSKLLLRKLLDFAPPNGLINALLMTGPGQGAGAAPLLPHPRRRQRILSKPGRAPWNSRPSRRAPICEWFSTFFRRIELSFPHPGPRSARPECKLQRESNFPAQSNKVGCPLSRA